MDVTISINPNRRNAEWWDAAQRSATAPLAVRPLLSPMAPEEITVSGEEALAILAWARLIPGWEDPGQSHEYPLVLG